MPRRYATLLLLVLYTAALVAGTSKPTTLATRLVVFGDDAARKARKELAEWNMLNVELVVLGGKGSMITNLTRPTVIIGSRGVHPLALRDALEFAAGDGDADGSQALALAHDSVYDDEPTAMRGAALSRSAVLELGLLPEEAGEEEFILFMAQIQEVFNKNGLIWLGDFRERRARRLDAQAARDASGLVDDTYYPPMRDVRVTADAALSLTLGYETTNDKVLPRGSRSISQAEAQCLLAGKKVALIGDSMTRFHYFVLNRFLGSGGLGPPLHVSRWGLGDDSIDYDVGSQWSETAGDKSHHRQFFKKTFEEASIETRFWFLVDWAVSGEAGIDLIKEVAEWADVVLLNVGWWELKECNGEEFYGALDEHGCRSRYKNLLKLLKKELLDKVEIAHFRTSNCCGEPREYMDPDRGDDLTEMAKSLWAMNQIVFDVFEDNTPVIDVWPLSTLATIDHRTQDGRHPTSPVYHVWTQTWLESLRNQPGIDSKRRDACALLSQEVSEPSRHPSKKPTKSPTPRPSTSMPTKAECQDGKKDGSETDVDCGGGLCGPCSAGRQCLEDSDCHSRLCVDKECADQPTALPTRKPSRHPTHDPTTRTPSPTGEVIAKKPAFVVDDDGGTGYGGTGKAGNHAVRSSTSEETHVAGWETAMRLTKCAEWPRGLKTLMLLGLVLGGLLVGSCHKKLLVLIISLRGDSTVSFSALPQLEEEEEEYGLEMSMDDRKHSNEADTEDTDRTPMKLQKKENNISASLLELVAWIGVAVLCDARAPAAVLPAFSRTESENPDLWVGLMVLLLALGWSNQRTLPLRESTVLNRAQTNEWKGWMQIAFVAYHYANCQDVYIAIRWFVSAYVWMTGFGNAMYCWKTQDYSAGRFLKSMWRINFFAAPLSLATQTPWMAYYVVALHSLHFALLFVCFKSAHQLYGFFFDTLKKSGSSSVSDLLYYSANGGERQNRLPANLLEKTMGLALLLVVDLVVWWLPGTYDLTVRPALNATLGEAFERYFWMRTKMDYLSSFSGALCALAFPLVLKTFSSSSESKRRVTKAAMFSVGLAGLIVGLWSWFTLGGTPVLYRDMNPYVGTLWIPLYALLRNSTESARSRVSQPLEWLGTRSLELYLLQFHLLMSRQASMVLWLIPDERWPLCNLVVVATLWCTAASRIFSRTAMLRDVAEAAPIRSASLLTLTACAYASLRLPALANSCTYSTLLATLLFLLSFLLGAFLTKRSSSPGS